MTDTQRRGRRIMMTPGERDAYLGEQRTCRVATLGADGAPHIGALWFVWDGDSLWLYSITRSLRWSQLRRDARIAVVVDDGEGYGELRGVELTGRAEFVGEAPRTGEPCPELVEAEELFPVKYFGMTEMPHDGRHAWLRLTPETITSWDFRKLAELA
ncbi:pyridoxamine 5'-phosphate oxidase family protein [Streptomyces anulatus]|uniref:pyridoxamine 5'-phosphate oxidase family protein n=1 Tax=Streptomyces TaxID=1883 RepID=UPI00070045F0|nr:MULTISPECIES: pyridoxamine 5'-phosphate oxidase family protein [Streptomyces]MDF9802402.1 nitroimidazol reductase NimA-like FMN-containing flavoprotein (pyridoxamine 5'-phosphate oxidase superfamily) [Streptomyces sp. HB372]KQX41884.1 pyridoxamine 5-phosphate oxidase [Streptomyces sp. Root1295]KRA30775.1 pyridoxamine 5-phosphate oxidase [Streptomyces sp. Root63]MBT1104478.1 pyridoxamine 5'-phosphate oxidase family protein [Streptomyces sp. Tu10]WSC60144.1 pyridoxamine 5'-phosphate oxidase f